MNVRLLQTRQELDDVYRLTHRGYLHEGYCLPSDDGRLMHCPHLDISDDTLIYLAVQDKKVVGTVSVTLDGPSKLYTDFDFPTETELVRQECNVNNQLLACSWRIVGDPDNHNNRTPLTLIKTIIGFCLTKPVDVLLCEVNPKHERFYRRVLGFYPVGASHCRLLSNAPAAILMRLNMAEGKVKLLSIYGRQ